MKALKQALQALLIAPDKEMRRRVETGEKEITIREGDREYLEGPVMLCCHIEPWVVMADIVNVSYYRLGEIPMEMLLADGYHSVAEALSDLKQYYPDITVGSKMTIIEWKNVRGFLVDEASK